MVSSLTKMRKRLEGQRREQGREGRGGGGRGELIGGGDELDF